MHFNLNDTISMGLHIEERQKYQGIGTILLVCKVNDLITISEFNQRNRIYTPIHPPPPPPPPNPTPHPLSRPPKEERKIISRSMSLVLFQAFNLTDFFSSRITLSCSYPKRHCLYRTYCQISTLPVT